MTSVRVFVTPVEGRDHKGRNPLDRPIAFFERQICLFEREGPKVTLGVPVQVMFTSVLFRKKDERFDMTDVAAVFVRPVTKEYILIDHDGFETSGSMCQTTATGYYRGKRKMLTPGRTRIWDADNVNAGFHNRGKIATRPGKVWVLESDWERLTPVRIEGLMRIEDAAYYPYIKRSVR